MYNPTSRALTVLELLQSRPAISGPEPRSWIKWIETPSTSAVNWLKRFSSASWARQS